MDWGEKQQGVGVCDEGGIYAAAVCHVKDLGLRTSVLTITYRQVVDFIL
jgi:hypothetical protein